MTWGPLLPDLDDGERKARARALWLAVRLLTGDRGKAAALALLRMEIGAGAPDLIAEAEAGFGRLGTVDQRRVLGSYRTVA